MDTQEEIKIFSGASATTDVGAFLLVENFQHIQMTLASAGNANFTIKFQISNSKDAPDFTAARSATNRWEYVSVKDLQTATGIEGDTGVAFTGTDDVRMFEINTNGQRWVSASITAISAGTVSLFMKPFNS